MQNLLLLLQELKVPAVEPVIMVETIDEDSTGKQEFSEQLQLDLPSDE